MLFLRSNNYKTIESHLFYSQKQNIINPIVWTSVFKLKKEKGQKLVFMKIISCELTSLLTKKSMPCLMFLGH